jgi:hypothetical protein
MTYCDTLGKILIKKIKGGKTLDEMGSELCGKSVKNPRQKGIRLIRQLVGEQVLIENADTLGYDVEKAELGKKPKNSLRKFKTDLDSRSEESEEADRKEMSLDDLVSALEKLITQTTPTTFVSTLETVLDRHKDLIEIE